MDRFIKNHSISRCAELALPRDCWNRSRFECDGAEQTPEAEKQAWIRVVRATLRPAVFGVVVCASVCFP